MAGMHLAHTFDLGPLILHPGYTLARALSLHFTSDPPVSLPHRMHDRTKYKTRSGGRSSNTHARAAKVLYTRVAVSYVLVSSPLRVHEPLAQRRRSTSA
jgi:hypothetical protein